MRHYVSLIARDCQCRRIEYRASESDRWQYCLVLSLYRQVKLLVRNSIKHDLYRSGQRGFNGGSELNH